MRICLSSFLCLRVLPPSVSSLSLSVSRMLIRLLLCIRVSVCVPVCMGMELGRFSAVPARSCLDTALVAARTRFQQRLVNLQVGDILAADVKTLIEASDGNLAESRH